MKKIILTIASALMLVLTFTSCAGMPGTTGTGEGGDSTQSMIMMVAVWGVLIVGVYFLLIRPNSKKKKEEQALRDSLEIGDDITTIGGIVGRVISIKEDTDTIIIETSSDRTKMQFKRWCIATVDTQKEPITGSSAQKEEKKVFFGRKK